MAACQTDVEEVTHINQSEGRSLTMLKRPTLKDLIREQEEFIGPHEALRGPNMQ